MKTIKPIATIHYCEVAILKAKLDDLITRSKISFYAFVYHYAEEDEKKNHIHLYCEPTTKTDTIQLRDELEIPSVDLTKPIRCLPFTPSKFSDWYLYSIHDIKYLTSKGQVRKFHYSVNDVVTDNEDYLIEKVHTIDMSKLNANYMLIEAVENGQSFTDLVKLGRIPAQLVHQYQTVFNIMKYGDSEVYRGNRYTHDNKPNRVQLDKIYQEDPQTGEITSYLGNSNKIADDDELPF